jgi:hypothetical protein
MQYFFYIFLYNIVPVSVIIGIGVVMQRVFKLDIRTLSKLNFYVFSPVIVFKLMYETELSAEVFGEVLLFFVIFYVALSILVEIFIKIRGYKGGMISAVRNSVMFNNAANYALPLNQLVFMNNPFTLSVQAVILMMMALLPNTYGVYSVNAHRLSMRQIMKTILSLPVLYVIPLAFLMRGFGIGIPEPLYVPLDYLFNAFIATALLTLGCQLGAMKWEIRFGDVFLSNVLRLLVSPLVGWVVGKAMGIDGIMLQALVLSCAMPSSLSSVLLAVEFDSEPEFASQTVFSSTVFSMFTMTLIIFWMNSPYF